MPRSVSSKMKGGGKPIEIRWETANKMKPPMVSPASKRSGKGKSPRRKVTSCGKKLSKFTSLKMAENWADAFDGNLWIYGKAEKQTQTVPAVPREIIILGGVNAE